MEIHKTDSQQTIKDYKIRSKKERTSSQEPMAVNMIQSTFLDELKKIELLPVEVSDSQSLEEIMSELDRQGREFQKKPVIEELVKYKTLVKRFLEFTVKKSLRVEEKKGIKKLSNRQKIWRIVSVVDKKLSELTLAIIEKEKENLNLAAKLDEIRGLLLDLYK